MKYAVSTCHAGLREYSPGDIAMPLACLVCKLKPVETEVRESEGFSQPKRPRFVEPMMPCPYFYVHKRVAGREEQDIRQGCDPQKQGPINVQDDQADTP